MNATVRAQFTKILKNAGLETILISRACEHLDSYVRQMSGKNVSRHLKMAAVIATQNDFPDIDCNSKQIAASLGIKSITKSLKRFSSSKCSINIKTDMFTTSIKTFCKNCDIKFEKIEEIEAYKESEMQHSLTSVAAVYFYVLLLSNGRKLDPDAFQRVTSVSHSTVMKIYNEIYPQ